MSELNESLLVQTQNMIKLMENFDEIDSSDELFKDDIKASLIKKIFDSEKSIAQKCDNLINFISSVESQIDAVKKMKEKFSKRQKTLENLISSTKKYIMYVSDSTEQKTFTGEMGSISVVPSPKSLQLIDFETSSLSVSNVVPESALEKIPSKYLMQKIYFCLDKEKVKQDLISGEPIFFAKIKQDSHVRIK